MKIKKAYTVDNILDKKFVEMPFTGEWLKSIGTPELSGVWIIWGLPGNGKTRFALQLSKYLAGFDKVIYDTLEEGVRRSMQLAIKQTNMKEVSKNFTVLNREPINELKVRLSKPKSPNIIIIDSFQYSGLTIKEYKTLKAMFPKKLFIFISHAEGKLPLGNPAKFVRYDADVKILVEGYKAFTTSRYGGGEEYVIYAEKAQEYWSNLN